jgi:hypothetical protein
MIFSLIDYYNYLRRSGRFSRDIKKSPMGGAFEGSLPEKALTILKPGDALFVQTYGWFLSWLVMYLTKSEISHAALYVGDNKIMHATFSGVVTEPIESLYGSNNLILPCIWSIPDEKRTLVVKTAREDFEGEPYGWLPVLLKGFRIITGRDWPYFRYTFLFDIGLVLTLLDIPFLLVLGHPVFSWLIFVYLSVISFNYFYWRIKPLKFSGLTIKPNDLLYIMCDQGASLVFDAYAISQQQRDESK